MKIEKEITLNTYFDRCEVQFQPIKICLILKKVDTFRNTKMSTLCIKKAKKSLLVKNG